MLNVARIRAITLDLDDTLWPIWPTIARAEQVLDTWLTERAPATASRLRDAEWRSVLRAEVEAAHPEWAHDLTALRRESIRLALERAGDDPTLAEPAFDVFFAERQRVDLFDDAVPALRALGARYPIVALSNGNADLTRVGLAAHFTAAVSAREFGVAKPHAPIFHAAARLVGVEPEAVLHVGDDPQLDILGGLGAGMQVAWVNRHGAVWAHEPQRPHLSVAHLGELCERVLQGGAT